MADNNMDINIKAKADKTDVVDLSEAITTLKEMDKNVEIDVNVDDSPITDTESSVESLDNSMEDASSSAEDLSDSVADVDSSAIDDVASSANDADENLNKASESANDVQVSISNIDPSVLEQIALMAGASADEMDRLKNNTDETSSSMSMVDAMASATLSAGVTAGFMSASNAAGNYSDTMVRLGYAMSSTSMTAEQAEQRYGSLISTMASETGRGAGAVRSHLINMGNAGITNEQILKDSFNGISKASFQMGESIDSMESKFQSMALTGMAGKRQLKAFGLEVSDLAEVMGVSVDEVTDKFKKLDADSRASVLATALNMKYGSEVTENYKNSYEHLIESLDRAKDYFIRVVGEALLPVLIPAIENAANIVNFFAQTFRGLPAPIKTVIGSAIGLVAGITAVGLGISATTKFITAAIAPFRILANSQRAAAIAQWLLNIAMDANPIVIVTLAIIALIAILGYLYFNNEQVRNAINGLGQTFVMVGQIIYGAVLSFVDMVIISLQNLWTYITTLGGLLPQSVEITGNQIIDTIIRVIAFILTLPLQLTIIFTNILANLFGFRGNFVNTLINTASSAVNGFISYIVQLPVRFGQELDKMLNQALDFAGRLPQIIWDAAINTVWGWIGGSGEHSPGFMYNAFEGELSAMASIVPVYDDRLNSYISRMGSHLSDNFGNSKLNNISSQEVNRINVVTSNNDNSRIRDLTINLEIGSVDKKERVDEIIETIRQYFEWNNTTAGRTV